MPTEQTSFSIINMMKLVNSPYGQFVSTLWKGKESRAMIKTHVSAHYEELEDTVKNGVTLSVDGVITKFNVIVFFIADLSFMKDVIGQSSSTSTYGCFHCKLPLQRWNLPGPKVGESKMVKEMAKVGETALEQLGETPDRDSAAFKKFQMNNHGQWVNKLSKTF